MKLVNGLLKGYKNKVPGSKTSLNCFRTWYLSLIPKRRSNGEGLVIPDAKKKSECDIAVTAV